MLQSSSAIPEKIFTLRNRSPFTLRGGTSAWLDSNQLSSGGDWEKDLEKALNESSSVVLVGSRASGRSAYVTAE